MAKHLPEIYPYHIQIELAGIPICLDLQYAEAYRYFGYFSYEEINTRTEDSPKLRLSEEDWIRLKSHGFSRCGQVEASFLASYCSDYLLEHDRCIIHAAAFRDDRRAWIIAADPGVGKSTQIRTLQELYPDVFSVICGDRPVLHLTDDGSVMVHPSPWNGKEFWGGAEAAPLAGIICLSRGETDRITKLSTRQAVLQIYGSLIHSAADEDIVRRAAAFEDELLRRVPVWDFVNRDIQGSSRLMYEHVLMEEAE